MSKDFSPHWLADQARILSTKCLGKEFCLACVEKVVHVAYQMGRRDQRKGV